jgi:hypothetical protein
MGGASSTTGGTRSPTHFGASSLSGGTWSPHCCVSMGGTSSTTGGTRSPPALGRVPSLLELGPRHRQDPYKFHHWWNLLRTIGAPPRSVQVPPVVERAADQVWCRVFVGGPFWGCLWNDLFALLFCCEVGYCVVVCCCGGGALELLVSGAFGL